MTLMRQFYDDLLSSSRTAAANVTELQSSRRLTAAIVWQIGTMEPGIRSRKLLIWLALSAVSTMAQSEERPFLRAPANQVSPVARLAVQYELKLTIPARGDLSQMLRDANIDEKDAVVADRLAVTDRAHGAGTCYAKISVTKAVKGDRFRLVRVLLIMPNGRQTVIERRGAEMMVASKTPARKSLRLV